MCCQEQCSTVVSTYCLEVSLLIVLIKTLCIKLFIYSHLSQEMNAQCNSSGVQENLVIQSMTFVIITRRILCTS